MPLEILKPSPHLLCLSFSLYKLRPVKIAIKLKILCLSFRCFAQKVANAVGVEPCLCQSQHTLSQKMIHPATT